MKHIDVHYFIQDKLWSGENDLKYCSTKDMVTYVLTKPLIKRRHQIFTRVIRLQDFEYLQSDSLGNRKKLLIIKGYS